MRRTQNNGGFWLCLLLNLILNLEWSLPAWILLILHFTLGWSLLWFGLALALWILLVLGCTGLLSWASNCDPPDVPKANRNPYSQNNNQYDHRKGKEN